MYYHCTGKRGGTCKKDYIREEKLNEVFLQLIDKLPNPKEGVIWRNQEGNSWDKKNQNRIWANEHGRNPKTNIKASKKIR